MSLAVTTKRFRNAPRQYSPITPLPFAPTRPPPSSSNKKHLRPELEISSSLQLNNNPARNNRHQVLQQVNGHQPQVNSRHRPLQLVNNHPQVNSHRHQPGNHNRRQMHNLYLSLQLISRRSGPRYWRPMFALLSVSYSLKDVSSAD